ncbi:hypothetical protein LBMAG16_13150 [Actinomycetes bacterium]|nr:hypothetical protein LBMAG16_13150 [Actinomycetes bacterium]
MALSDNEKQILAQIEHDLKADERFAQAVSSSGLYRHSARTAWWAGVGVVVCLALTILALQIHFLLAFAGFMAMLGCALVVERQLRAMSKVGLRDMAETLRSSRMNAQKMREKFTRER